ncbi:hypothetical protein P368_11610 [Comamonas thiooxydans]|nr:hypothetical protein P369_10345 [Comamonas thiooxydans]KGG98380.1 hypothetical protein P367_12610 [Comamonas thiooxydans]KGH04158.1 hypothetical protein P365_13790 [Comamonas thiooxydans]KGH12461.1 hypothetical protein P368_11610 [Comamonas thiooxydans]KGH20223.1 hypothetical protein P606_21345 [Comamonas thiooxydans]
MFYICWGLILIIVSGTQKSSLNFPMMKYQK